MTTINLTDNTTTFELNGITYRMNTETNRYSKTVNGKTTRIGKAEFEAAQNEYDLHRDAEELEKYLQEQEESNTDEEIATIIEGMDADAEDDSISAEEFIEKIDNLYTRHPEGTDLQKPAVINQYGCVDCSKCNVQNCVHRDCMRRNPTSEGGLAECPRLKVKAEEPKKEKKAKKAAKKNAYHTSTVAPGVTLTEKQVDFILHLSDSNFWENGLDSMLWVDVLCDEIRGQFEGKPMTVGAMISTLCEKGLGSRATERRGAHGGKVTSFALTEMGKQVAAELGLN